MKIMINFLISILLIGNIACNSPVSIQNKNSKPIDHQIWDKLLKKHVGDDGFVNYKGFIKDSVEFNSYLKMLSDNPPAENWTENEQKAYWINAYNAFTIKLILKYYPVKSIKDIGSSIQIPFVNTPWDVKFIQIGKEKYNLNNIEHGILRKKFSDPRIHMTLVCASHSCPSLWNHAYSVEDLDKQMDDRAATFINDPTRNKVEGTKSELSKIFDWYKMDFNKKGSVMDFINKYSKVKLTKETKISYLDYDWNLNEK